MTASSSVPGRPGPAAAADRDFLLFADHSRDLLRGCALLLTGDPDRGDRLAGSVLARVGGRPVAGTQRWAAAWAELARPRPASFDPPWSGGRRVELVDGTARVGDPLLAELQRLAPEPRAALVLTAYAGVPPAEAAAALQTSAATVELEVQQAVRALAEGRPGRQEPGRLADELRASAEAHLSARPWADSALTDLAHARQLVRRRRVRTLTGLVAVVLVLVLGTASLVRAGSPGPAAGPLPSAPVPSAPPVPVPSATHSGVVTARCNINDPSCQATVSRDWRTTMARVTASHLDPSGRYFTDYRYSYDPRYETPSFWKGGDGALGLDVYRSKRGTTEIYLQISTDDRHATTCGRSTGQGCTSMEFMDGDRFTLSDSSRLSDGIEVQYQPDDQVITVVARRSGRSGQALDVTRGELLNLVRDPRLRLPVI